MAIKLIIKDGTTDLGDTIRDLIDEKKLLNWEYDVEGDFTLSSVQWRNKAWFRIYKDEKNPNSIKFGIIGRKEQSMGRTLYAVYHGRFAEMLLSHFDRKISNMEITPMKDLIDSFH